MIKKFIQNKLIYSITRNISLGNQQISTVNDLHVKQQFRHKVRQENNDQFGNDLAYGEIPLELSFCRKTETGVLSNGISVTTVDYISPIVTISVFIRCGSVNEKESASGAAHFLEHMHFKGTPTRSRKNLELEIENKGAHLNAYTTRDYTSYILNVFEDKVDWGIEFLSDILLNSKYDHDLIERERSTIETELLECQKEEFETVLENSHMTAFEGSSIARPILGLVQNIKSVTRQQIVDFHDQNYTGENLLFVVSGNVKHADLTQSVQKHFGKMQKTKKITDLELLKNLERPKFVPRVSFIDGPEGSLKIGMFWEAPCWSEPDYVAFLILQRIVGDYEQMDFKLSEKKTSLSEVATFLSDQEKIRKLKTGFTPYRNAGLFGCFIEGEESAGIEMVTFLRSYMQDLGNNIKDSDVLKIRSNLFSELMMIESGNDVTQDTGCYLTYLNRIVGKSEMAKRISLSCDREYLMFVLDEWIVNKPFSLTFWGNTQSISFPKNFLLK